MSLHLRVLLASLPTLLAGCGVTASNQDVVAVTRDAVIPADLGQEHADTVPQARDSGQDDSSEQLLAQLAEKRVLWVGAHPDDEASVGPLLAEACLERASHCTFLVATRGEAGSCALPTGCPPELGSFRAEEMARVAARYHAALLQWDLPDSAASTPEGVAQAWATRRGSPELLVTQLRAAILDAQAEVVLSFDPRHGTTCHPDHRAISALVLLSLQNWVGSAPLVWLVESRFHEQASPPVLGFVPASTGDSALASYDATRSLGSVQQSAWDFLLGTLATHASQFDALKLQAFGNAPPSERRSFVLPLTAAVADDPRYALCP